MEKPSVYEASFWLACAKDITFHIWTHYNSTGVETCMPDRRVKKAEDDMFPYEYRDVELIMVTAAKKDSFEVYGIRYLD